MAVDICLKIFHFVLAVKQENNLQQLPGRNLSFFTICITDMMLQEPKQQVS